MYDAGSLESSTGSRSLCSARLGGTEEVSGGAFTRARWLQSDTPSGSGFDPTSCASIWGELLRNDSGSVDFAGPSAVGIAHFSAFQGRRNRDHCRRARRDIAVNYLADLLRKKAKMNPTAEGELAARRSGVPDEREDPACSHWHSFRHLSRDRQDHR